MLDGDPMGIRRRPAYLHRRQKLQIEGSPSIAADHGWGHHDLRRRRALSPVPTSNRPTGDLGERGISSQRLLAEVPSLCGVLVFDSVSRAPPPPPAASLTLTIQNLTYNTFTYNYFTHTNLIYNNFTHTHLCHIPSLTSQLCHTPSLTYHNFTHTLILNSHLP